MVTLVLYIYNILVVNNLEGNFHMVTLWLLGYLNIIDILNKQPDNFILTKDISFQINPVYFNINTILKLDVISKELHLR